MSKLERERLETAEMAVADPAVPVASGLGVELSEREYAELRVEVDGAADPDAVLAGRGLDRAAYATLREHWLRRCLGDDELVTRLAALMREARHAGGDPGGAQP